VVPNDVGGLGGRTFGGLGAGHRRPRQREGWGPLSLAGCRPSA
jgi:hypothetical protein